MVGIELVVNQPLVQQRVCVLGSTGSIGVSTLDVLKRHPDRYKVVALSAHKNIDLLLQQCEIFSPEVVTVTDADAGHAFIRRLAANSKIDVRLKASALEEMVTVGCDTVVCGIVGAAGLASTIAAVRAGKRVLLANKEPLVMMGHAIVDLAQQSGALLLPVDSEHNAVFQCLPAQTTADVQNGQLPYTSKGVRRILLTGSGGPFRERDISTFGTITPDQACAHPNWQMGRKISVDSATMMNKGLELIEACVLFGMDEKQVDIVIHPQSVIHSMVEYDDGSILAQLGSPDMRIPIANALAWPDRVTSGADWLDVIQTKRFDFDKPDDNRFPAIGLARHAASVGGSAPVILNAANEIAVDTFLRGSISFNQISDTVAFAMDKLPQHECGDLDDVLRTDRLARECARGYLAVA